MLATAAWTIAARGSFAAVVAYVAYGLLVSLVWVRLFAVDVALTEAAVGSGVTGVLLISAVVRLRGTEAPMAAERPGVRLRVLSAALAAVVAAGLASIAFFMPETGPTLAPQAAEHLGELRPRQCRHRRADRLSRARHHAGEGRADPGRDRCVVAGSRSLLGRRHRPAARRASAGGARLPRPAAAAVRHRGRHPHRLGRRRRAGRRLSGRRHPCRHVDDRRDGEARRSPADKVAAGCGSC